MKQRKKIAIYSGDIPSTTFIERLIQGIATSQYQIMLFGFIKSSPPVYNNNVRIIGYLNSRIYKGLHLLKYTLLLTLFRYQQKIKLDKILKEMSKDSSRHKVKFYPVLWHKPDIFHIQWAKSLEEWMWVKKFGIKLVLSLRGAHINYSPIADEKLAHTYRDLFPQVDQFHAVSKAIGEEAQKYGANSDQIKVVYSGLDLNRTSHNMEQVDKSDHFQIISVGRSHWVKGYSYALDACRLLKLANFKFNYTIIGASDDLELLYQINDMNLKEEVHVKKTVSFENVKAHIQDSDLLFLPSLKEGLANVVLEAMSLRTIVLSTDCGGMHEVITPGENGFLTLIRDPEHMAKQIIEIASLDDDKKSSIQNRAEDYVKAHHSNESMVKGIQELYDSLLTR